MNKESWIHEAHTCLKLKFHHYIHDKPGSCSARYYRAIGDAVRHVVILNAFHESREEGGFLATRNVISRGFETRIKGGMEPVPTMVFHREIHEAVTDLLAVMTHPQAVPHFETLLPFAQEVSDAIGPDRLAEHYFERGYKGLAFNCYNRGVDLRSLELRARSVLPLSSR